MTRHFPNIEEYNSNPILYMVHILSWRDDVLEAINNRIKWLKDTADGGTPPCAELRVYELEQIIEMLNYRKEEK